MPELDYANVPLAPDYQRVNRYFRVALFCAAAPLVVGYTLLFAYWLAYRWWIYPFGCLTFLLGIISVIVGIGYFIKYTREECRFAKTAQTPIRWRRIIFLLLLLILDIPAGWAGAFGGMLLENRVFIDVINDSGAPIDNCDVRIDRQTYSTGPIAPGSTLRLKLRYQYTRTPLQFEIQQGTNHATETASRDAKWARIRVKPGFVTTVEIIH